MKKTTLALAISCSLLAAGCADDGKDGATGPAGAVGTDGKNGVSVFVSRQDVVKTNANIAYAVYSDSLVTAYQLKDALQALVDTPSAQTFTDAKQAWLDAREPYGQSEVYRFRKGPIDALKDDGSMGKEGDGPEGRINAWPLGEAIIDYIAPVVDGDAGPETASAAFTGNIIANVADIPTINKSVLKDNFEFGEDERNVTSGYHAIEFLLWGQDLNADGTGAGTRDATAGHRPLSDFYTAANGHAGKCTSGVEMKTDNICTRRGDYLLAAADLLIDDLANVTGAWEPGSGVHYQSFVAGGDTSLAKILEGMGRLSYGELAGERINIALSTDSQEDEHSCFSDNTHRDIYLNAKGVQNAYLGSYTRVNGEQISGASIYDLLVVEGHHEDANSLRGSLEATMAAASVLNTKADIGKPFDILIQNPNQPNIKAVIDALVLQTEGVEEVIKDFGVTTGSLCDDTEEDIGACGG